MNSFIFLFLQQLHSEVEDAASEVRGAEDKARKAQSEVNRLENEVKTEHDRVVNLEKLYKSSDSQIKVILVDIHIFYWHFSLLWNVTAEWLVEI